MQLPVRSDGTLPAGIVDARGHQVAKCATATERDRMVKCINKHVALVLVLRQIIGHLPDRREWLDADIERLGRELLQDEPAAAALEQLYPCAAAH